MAYHSQTHPCYIELAAGWREASLRRLPRYLWGASYPNRRTSGVGCRASKISGGGRRYICARIISTESLFEIILVALFVTGGLRWRTTRKHTRATVLIQPQKKDTPPRRHADTPEYVAADRTT